MRLVAGNWKMNHGPTEAREWTQGVRERLKSADGRRALIFPPFTLLGELAELLRGSSVALGGQNLYPVVSGAFTGEISPRQLRELGAEFVLVGHSERRMLLGEDLAFIHRKVESALAEGLTPVLCVGERREERADGRTAEILRTQVLSALEGLPPTERLVVAYEPVWAIGSGEPAGPVEAADGARVIRAAVAEAWGSADALPVLYGGSVSGENFPGFLATGTIDGCLAGGASLTATGFLSLWDAAL